MKRFGGGWLVLLAGFPTLQFVDKKKSMGETWTGIIPYSCGQINRISMEHIWFTFGWLSGSMDLKTISDDRSFKMIDCHKRDSIWISWILVCFSNWAQIPNVKKKNLVVRMAASDHLSKYLIFQIEKHSLMSHSKY